MRSRQKSCFDKLSTSIYEKQNAKVVFEKLYADVDIAETLSNLSGKHIKQIFENKVVFEDGCEVIYDEMTFEKYP